MHKRLALVCSVLIAAGCSSGRYFPRGAHHPEAEWDNFTERWYASGLVALEEESLCCSERGRTYVIRFTRLPALGNATVIRVDNERGHWVLHAKAASGKGGAAPGHPITRSSRRLPNSDVEKLLALVSDTSDFWSLPHDVSDANIVVLDGVVWILEVRHDAKYHFIHENWPDEGTLRGVGDLLISLAGEKSGISES